MAPLLGAGKKKFVSNRDWHATEWIAWRSTQSVGGAVPVQIFVFNKAIPMPKTSFCLNSQVTINKKRVCI